MLAQTGWIDRNGYFHKCEWHQHAELAKTKFNKAEQELEQLGWIKITRLANQNQLFWVMRDLGRMTPEQGRKLQRMGFDVIEDDVTYG